jgi:hypothetical protein
MIVLLGIGCRKESTVAPTSIHTEPARDAQAALAADADSVVDAAAEEGPLRAAWRQCTNDADCVVISSECGTAFVNVSAKQEAQAAWAAACTDPPPPSGELGKRPVAACRNSRCVDRSDLGSQLGR